MKIRNGVVFLFIIIVSFSSCQRIKDYMSPPDAHALKQREQNKIKSKFSISLRAAHTAYNVKRFELAVLKFEPAISQGWLDGEDLYLYAMCLEKLGKIEISEKYFQKAFNELRETHPNHTYLDDLKMKGYK